MTVWTIVVAAGGGERFGAAKQFERLGDRTVLDRALDTAVLVSDGVVAVVRSDAEWQPPAPVKAVPGGATRAASVRAGLGAIPDEVDVIVVHDAARPLATVDLYRSVLAAIAAGADGAVPGLPVADTVKRISGATVVETLDRAALVAVQTPQAFRAEVLRRAHAGAGDATDDAALVEALGGRVVVVPGDPDNFKITQPIDLDAARQRLAEAGAL